MALIIVVAVPNGEYLGVAWTGAEAKPFPALNSAPSLTRNLSFRVSTKAKRVSRDHRATYGFNLKKITQSKFYGTHRLRILTLSNCTGFSGDFKA
ncbi:Uncharacterized protein APZ42_021993 [Daphnia magna]|uniref:Uncharacterized protein n=1 Tax=Daphnia magna TaxID=35525 RepID=A0A164W6C7_9CRUS|nr:Uncharacterized protein APZ42_021993 [Daphnia magna]